MGWTANGTAFDNAYFRSLISNEWALAAGEMIDDDDGVVLHEGRPASAFLMPMEQILSWGMAGASLPVWTSHESGFQKRRAVDGAGRPLPPRNPEPNSVMLTTDIILAYDLDTCDEAHVFPDRIDGFSYFTAERVKRRCTEDDDEDADCEYDDYEEHGNNDVKAYDEMMMAPGPTGSAMTSAAAAEQQAQRGGRRPAGGASGGVRRRTLAGVAVADADERDDAEDDAGPEGGEEPGPGPQRRRGGGGGAYADRGDGMEARRRELYMRRRQEEEMRRRQRRPTEPAGVDGEEGADAGDAGGGEEESSEQQQQRRQRPAPGREMRSGEQRAMQLEAQRREFFRQEALQRQQQEQEQEQQQQQQRMASSSSRPADGEEDGAEQDGGGDGKGRVGRMAAAAAAVSRDEIEYDTDEDVLHTSECKPGRQGPLIKRYAVRPPRERGRAPRSGDPIAASVLTPPARSAPRRGDHLRVRSTTTPSS